jgi:hypothetical protein
MQGPKLGAVDIGARHKNSVLHLLGDREVIHSGYRCAEHDLPCDVSSHSEYGFTS